MNENKKDWVDEVIHSMEGSSRALPHSDLLSKIEQSIQKPESVIVTITQWRFAATAAAVILLLNITALLNYSQETFAENQEKESIDLYDQSLISSFKIYE